MTVAHRHPKVAYPVAHLVGRDVSAEVPPRPVVGVEQPAQKLEERAPAGAVGGQERQPLAGGDGNVHLVDGDRPVRASVGEPARLDGGTVVVHDHHVDGIADALQTIQHEMADHITSVQHIHLSHDTCMETLVVDGPGTAITELANRLADAVERPQEIGRASCRERA